MLLRVERIIGRQPRPSWDEDSLRSGLASGRAEGINCEGPTERRPVTVSLILLKMWENVPLSDTLDSIVTKTKEVRAVSADLKDVNGSGGGGIAIVE